MTLGNYTPNGVLSLYTVKDSFFNEETKRKDIRVDTLWLLSLRTKKEVREKIYRER